MFCVYIHRLLLWAVYIDRRPCKMLCAISKVNNLWNVLEQYLLQLQLFSRYEIALAVSSSVENVCQVRSFRSLGLDPRRSTAGSTASALRHSHCHLSAGPPRGKHSEVQRHATRDPYQLLISAYYINDTSEVTVKKCRELADDTSRMSCCKPTR